MGIMRLLSGIVFCGILLMRYSEGSAQSIFVADSVYGFDPLLYNGRQYTNAFPKNAEGSPFYFDDYTTGSLVIRNTAYQGLSLNLDLVNHLLVIKYLNHEGALVIMEIPDAWLEYAQIGGVFFEPVVRPDGKHAYYRFSGDQNFRIRFYHWKDLKLENSFSTPVYSFSRPLQEAYVVIRGRQFPFRNNRSFVKAFDVSIQESINNYLKNNNIKVAKAALSDLDALVNFCQKNLTP